MPLPYPRPAFVDGQYVIDPTGPYGTGVPVTLPVLSQPIPGVNAAYMLKQDFEHALDGWAPLALNTAHPVFTRYYLVEESEKQDIGGGMVRWNRTYCQIPASHEGDPEMANYSFIGLTITLPSSGTQTRNRRGLAIESKTIFDYFLVPSGPLTDPITGDNYSIADWGDIKSILDMQYVSQGVIGGVTYGGVTLAVDFLNLAGTVLPTWPTSEQYQDMIADAIANRWNATKTKVVIHATDATHVAGVIDTAASVLGGQIPIEPSRVTRWMGNIYQRATRYVLAQ